MNAPDPFEERLARTPFRPAPSSLREKVLEAAAGAASSSARSEPVVRAGWLAEWLWPYRAAWGALGVAWVAVVLLNLAAFDTSENAQVQPGAGQVSPAWTAALREQHALLRSLLQEPPSAMQPEPGPDARIGRPESYFGPAVAMLEISVLREDA